MEGTEEFEKLNRVYNIPPQDRILSQMNQFQVFTSYFQRSFLVLFLNLCLDDPKFWDFIKITLIKMRSLLINCEQNKNKHKHQYWHV